MIITLANLIKSPFSRYSDGLNHSKKSIFLTFFHIFQKKRQKVKKNLVCKNKCLPLQSQTERSTAKDSSAREIRD